MVPYQTPIIAKKYSVIFVMLNVTVATRKLCKNTPYFGFSCLYLKNEPGHPNFLFLKCNQHARINLSAKFKRILWSRFRATVNNWKFKVSLNPLHRICLNFAEVFVLVCWSLLCNKKWGSPSSFLRYKQLKPKYGVFLQGFPVAMVT